MLPPSSNAERLGGSHHTISHIEIHLHGYESQHFCDTNMSDSDDCCTTLTGFSIPGSGPDSSPFDSETCTGLTLKHRKQSLSHDSIPLRILPPFPSKCPWNHRKWTHNPPSSTALQPCVGAPQRRRVPQQVAPRRVLRGGFRLELRRRQQRAERRAAAGGEKGRPGSDLTLPAVHMESDSRVLADLHVDWWEGTLQVAESESAPDKPLKIVAHVSDGKELPSHQSTWNPT